MRSRRLPVPSYANVVATIALFVALGGTTVAATQIRGSQIKRGTITGAQVRTGSIPGGDLRRDSVSGRQIDEARLGAVPLAGKASLADRAQSAARADSAATAGSAADSTLLGGRPAGAYLESCEPGTTPYAGVCFETATRSAVTWPAAAEICGDAGGRLPSLDELEGFRQEPGVTLSSPEHTSTYLDLNGIEAGGEATVGLYDNGARSPGFAYGSSSGAYRCVKPMSDR